MDDKAETRDRILEAAGRRFDHYGYNKTTMSEIAADLKMSTGNLYRFYPSKLDIAEAFARAHEVEEDAIMEGIVESDSPAEARMREFHRTVLERTFNMIDKNKKLFELAQAIAQERPAYSNRRLAAERVYLEKILKDGIEDGSFAPCDNLDELAEMIQCATMKFRFPQLYNCFRIDMLRRELEGTMDLLYRGLLKR